MRILVVEDERELASALARGLGEEGHAADVAHTLSQARDLAIGNHYDLVVLDLQLPDGTGLGLLREWRGEGASFPVLVLTARDRVEQRVEGLDAGADDYLTKPFAFDELLARVRALDRRRPIPVRDILRRGDLVLDRTAREVRIGEVPIDLTPRELALLEYFLLHPRTALSRSRIARDVWEDQGGTASNVIDVLIGRVRRKVAAAGSELAIRPIHGVGYLLDAAPEGR